MSNSSDKKLGPISKESKKLKSCHRCRAKKIRCDNEFPCTHCKRHNTECIRSSSDRRKERFSSSYVEKLVSKVSTLEDTLAKVYSNLQKNKELIENLGVSALNNASEVSEISSNNTKINEDGDISLYNDVTDSTSYPRPDNFSGYGMKDQTVYGPTSVLDAETQIESSPTGQKLELINLKKDANIIEAIKLFFRWQYPDHNIFIFREAFLNDFFHPSDLDSYCSVELVLAISALGSLMSDNLKLQENSKSYYDESKSRLFKKYDIPNVTSLQSFLLLSFYDICQGSNSSGWMLSGIGLRMGFDLGFQLHPKSLFFKSNSDVSSLSVEVRSRIFWGCYMADHFLSLLLGRPSLLKMSDIAIPETDDLPDIEWIDEYTYQSPSSNGKHKALNISLPLKCIIQLTNISADMLNEVFTSSSQDNGNKSTDKFYNLPFHIEKLIYYNNKILAWKSDLPDILQWNSNTLNYDADNPTIMTLRYYYYILLLCLNRPFLHFARKKTKGDIFSDAASPLDICSGVISDAMIAIERFRSVHGLKKASIFIVYCSILSVSSLFLISDKDGISPRDRTKLDFFVQVLKECSPTWRLAERSRSMIIDKIKTHEEGRILYRKSSKNSHGQDSDNLDFTNNNQKTKGVHSPVSPGDSEAMTHFNQTMEHFGGPPLLIPTNLFGSNWEDIFPDYIGDW